MAIKETNTKRFTEMLINFLDESDFFDVQASEKAESTTSIDHILTETIVGLIGSDERFQLTIVKLD